MTRHAEVVGVFAGEIDDGAVFDRVASERRARVCMIDTKHESRSATAVLA